ncbi:glutamate carboxypeptidase [Penicillium chermesinum]|nr:glutamate carboxypeptidase [Penicillium chermesinum]
MLQGLHTTGPVAIENLEESRLMIELKIGELLQTGGLREDAETKAARPAVDDSGDMSIRRAKRDINRVCEIVVYTSILPYLPELIEYVGVPEAEVAKWVGIASAVSSISQALMAVPWGTLSDYIGRKPVIISGLTCTMVFSIMLGMSHSLTMVLLTRTLIGFFNGNVGIYRTIVAEIVPERELQPRAFSIMPLETLETKKDKKDYGRELGKVLTRPCTSRRKRLEGAKAADEERASLLPPSKPQVKNKGPAPRPRWSEIFTFQSILILISYTMVSGLGMAFDAVFPAFLSYPVQNLHDNPEVKLPFKFAGGFGIDSQTIGIYYTIIGCIGMVIQFYAFPPVVHRLGTLRCFKAAAIAMPVVFFLTPFMVLVPESFRLPAALAIMLGKLGVTIFGVPCCTILLTNSAASMSVLGTLNGVGTSVSALGRAGGPALIGAAFSFGVKRGIVPAFWIVEQDGPHRGNAIQEEEESEGAETSAGGYGSVASRA